MEPMALQVEVRDGRGKGPARQLRAKGLLPAVFYGPGVETTGLALSPKELTKALETEYRLNVVLKLAIAGTEHLAMVKDVQVHPVTRTPVHVDLYKVSNDRQVTVSVPLRTSGRALGVQKGGRLNVVFRELPVRSAPESIPAALTVNVASLDMGEVFKVQDLELPDGVQVLLPPDRRLVLITEDRKRATPEEEAQAQADSSEEKAEKKPEK